MSESERPRPRRTSSMRLSAAPPGKATLRGICASPGIAVGPVTLFDRRSVAIPRRLLSDGEIDGEVGRLLAAFAASRRLLEEARDALGPEAGAENRLVLEAHLLMHRDELLVGGAVEGVRAGRNAEWAVRRVVDATAQRMSEAAESYLACRARDVEQIGEQVLRILTGQSDRLPSISAPTILVASDLSPAETARLPREQVLGLVTDLGTASSHTALLARALGIPAVVGVDGVTRALSPGDIVIVDALRGEVVVAPDEAERKRADERARRYHRFAGQLRTRSGRPGATRDGVRVELLANVELEVEVERALAHRAEGIGLYRTEFLALEGQPDEDAQTEIYARVAGSLAPRPVTLRTFDLGADKGGAEKDKGAPSRGPNPALGLRGLRLSLSQPAAFKVQLRAILRAAAGSSIRVMFPMVCTLDELRAAKALLAEAARELDRSGISYRPVSVGVMIEVPSAVVLADLLARECDFFSVGTNDLAQYALAVDRQNPRLSHLVRAVEPAVLRMLDSVRAAAGAARIPVSVCGDLAAHPLALPLLVGLGFRSLSMPPSELALARAIIERVDAGTCEELARACLACPTARAIEARLAETLGPDLGDIWEEQGVELAAPRA